MYVAEGMRGRWRAWLLVGCLWMGVNGALGLVLVEEDGHEVEYKHEIARFGYWKPSEDYATKGIRGGFATLEESDDLCGKLDSVDVKGKLVLYDSKVSPKDCNFVDVVCSVQYKKGVVVIIVWEDAANISLLNVDADAQKPIDIPVVWTTRAFVTKAQQLITKQGHAEVVLNSRGDKDYETNWFATFLYAFVDLVFSASFGAIFATVAIGVVDLIFVTFLCLSGWFTRQWRKRQISQLPVREYYPRSPEDDESCVICMDSYERGEKVMVFPCAHIFHYECIIDWLYRSRLCPMCKRDVYTSAEETSSYPSNHDSTSGEQQESHADGQSGREHLRGRNSRVSRGRGRGRGRDYVAVTVIDSSDGSGANTS